jgi:hypothetical protein
MCIGRRALRKEQRDARLPGHRSVADRRYIHVDKALIGLLQDYYIQVGPRIVKYQAAGAWRVG